MTQNTTKERLEALQVANDALDKIYSMVSYINSHTVGANLTENVTDGPKVIMPASQEVWDILMAIGKTSNAALKITEPALLDAKTAPTGWNFNMDEAPKDGTWISDCYLGKIRWEKGLMLCNGAWTTTPKTNGTHQIVAPTAWQHLPTPPEKKE